MLIKINYTVAIKSVIIYNLQWVKFFESFG